MNMFFRSKTPGNLLQPQLLHFKNVFATEGWTWQSDVGGPRRSFGAPWLGLAEARLGAQGSLGGADVVHSAGGFHVFFFF